MGEDAPLGWPRPLQVNPRTVVIVAAVWVIAAWMVFLAIDIVGLVDVPGEHVVWLHLFNDRPVEWAQWLLQGSAILVAGFTAGRLASERDRGLRAFLLILGAGLVLMLFEDAGDARHAIGSYVSTVFGTEIAGLPRAVVTDVPYFLVVAALPILALLRYRQDAWRAPTARPYLVAGYGLYALAGGGSGIRHLGGLYSSIGAAIDRVVLGGRFPVPAHLDQERAHFLLVDSLIEESIETLAAASLLAVMLAIGRDIRANELVPRSERGATRHGP